MNRKAFLNGTCFDAYEYLGAHKENESFVFRTYAPKADRAALTGTFNGWLETPMHKDKDGFFTCTVAGAQYGHLYKYILYSKEGRVEHCDPFGFELERGRGHCSILRDPHSYRFHDDYWMKHRSLNFEQPMNIYEMHIGSWRKKQPAGWQWYNYDELAEPLIRYLQDMGYTHVEFLPLAEHPMDGSWGYQQSCLFSPTSRYGHPDQLKFLIDQLHKAGIGVILDFVTVHFSTDAYGLKQYGAKNLFEPRLKKEQKSDWGSLYFDHSSPVVRSFLQSAGHYWLNEYHIDGLRFDAVSHLIYRHGRWEDGENSEGQNFLRSMNSGLQQRHPTAMRIAEDSTAFAGVTHPVEEGGLGFHYKWAMGFSFDTFSYFTVPMKHRPGLSRKLTFSKDYFPQERFLLPFSHDEVSPGHPSLYERMPGRSASRLRNLKLLQLYMAVHPGKKMNFMGNDFAMEESWNVGKSLPWKEAENKEHKAFVHYMKTLNHLILQNSALYEADYKDWSFDWLSCDDNGNGIYALIRHSTDHHVMAVFNFSDEDRTHFIHCPHIKEAELLLHTDHREFAGTTARKTAVFTLENNGLHITLPRLSGVLLEILFH